MSDLEHLAIQRLWMEYDVLPGQVDLFEEDDYD